MSKLREHMKMNFVQWFVVVILAASMFSASKRAVIPAIMALGRFFMPFIIVWVAYRLIKSKITATFQRFQNQMAQAMQNGPQGGGANVGGGSGQVIDLCPKCGSYKNTGHSCSK